MEEPDRVSPRWHLPDNESAERVRYNAERAWDTGALNDELDDGAPKWSPRNAVAHDTTHRGTNCTRRFLGANSS